MKAFALLFSEFVSSNSGRLPTDEAQLKDFIRKKGARTAAKGTTSNIDDLFASERDGQPLVIKYAEKSAPASALAPDTVIAYEKRGVGGKRLVALPNGGVAELDKDSFAIAMSGGAPNSN